MIRPFVVPLSTLIYSPVGRDRTGTVFLGQGDFSGFFWGGWVED